MAKFKQIQNTFSQGMLSPKLRGRTDLAEYFQGAEKSLGRRPANADISFWQRR